MLLHMRLSGPKDIDQFRSHASNAHSRLLSVSSSSCCCPIHDSQLLTGLENSLSYFPLLSFRSVSVGLLITPGRYSVQIEPTKGRDTTTKGYAQVNLTTQ